CQKYSSPPHTF
nr:immunoglobulin light chain junction region [Macaca mulatta]MOV35053.1 immunoglobulin light chain junction region [Macaca mulatta]MOW61691.1 immunoglobulin light chain junction region [Macaca mulatta]MOW61811.1 immunoglobulin light chain junction region [Macaca mulatta]MOW61856.1 immunoglobulin light chain junction region [Macaca mulatta]